MQKNTTAYYDRFSKVYDIFSPRSYYHKARLRAVSELHLTEGKSVLNVPVGTGINFGYLQGYLQNTGIIIGVDLSEGMIAKARIKKDQAQWKNIQLVNQNVNELGAELSSESLGNSPIGGFDAILCDLGLSCFPDWERTIDELVLLLSKSGRISIMDWYIEKPSLRASFVNWIGKGEVNRPIWQYLENKVSEFKVDSSFNRGGVFVASGTKIIKYEALHNK